MATIKDYARMCEAHEDCDDCPLKAKRSSFESCRRTILSDANKAEKIIDNWCAEHPAKTYADDFFEKFPNAVYKQGRNNKYPAKCRNYFYTNCKGGVRNESNCDGGCEYCWNEECDE